MTAATPPPGSHAVLVLGAGGATGRVLVTELLAAGHRVTAAARHPADLPEFTPSSGGADTTARLSTIRVDVRDAHSVTAATPGHDIVISAVGPPGRRPRGLYSATAHSLVAASSAHDVDRLMVITSAGLGDRRGHALWYRIVAATLLRDLYADMRRLEATIRGSAVAWTFVRPARIVDDVPTASFRVEDAATPSGGRRITRVDLARFVVDEIDARRWIRSAPTLAH